MPTTADGGGRPSKDEPKKQPQDADRRAFLKATVVASAALAVVGAAALSKTIATPGEAQAGAPLVTSFPNVQIQDEETGQLLTLSALQDNSPHTFNYPLDNEPNIIVKLGFAVEDGVGPDSDIVAFSDICQHLGCNPEFLAAGQSAPKNNFTAKGPVMFCHCHGSVYDLTEDAKVIGGPAPYPVPRVILDIDSSGNIHATGMGPPTIFAHGPAGSDDVSYDLQGGTPVT